MKKRLGLIATRLAILFLLAIAVLVGRDALVQRLLVSKAQAWLGAKVEIGQVRTSFQDGKLYIRDLALADPRNPMVNLIQAESAILQVDLDRLARKQFVVDDATATRVFFAAPRSFSGKLGNGNDVPLSEKGSPTFELNHEPSNSRHEWLDRFEHTTDGVQIPSLATEKTASELVSRWAADLQQQRQKVENLKQTLRTIHDLVAFETNPLRSKNLEQAEELLDGLETDIREMTTNLAMLDQRVIDDRVTLANSKSEDERSLLDTANAKQLSGTTISQILLHEDQLQRTREVLNWYFSFREFIPDPSSDFLTRKPRGEFIPILGFDNEPGLYIKNIQLDGEGRIAGNSFNFSGTAKNISSNPAAMGIPTTIELRAQGKAHAFVSCSLDRSNGQQNDSLHISCPDLPFDSTTLGDQQSLRMNVSPCRTNVEMDLQCHDGKLFGCIKFDHSNLVMQIEYLDELAGGAEVAQRINLELASISDYSVITSITGTVEKPFVRIESNLGERLASKFNEILGKHTRAVANRVDRVYHTALEQLNSEIAEEISRISQSLQDQVIVQRTRTAEELNHRLKRDTLDSSLIR